MKAFCWICLIFAWIYLAIPVAHGNGSGWQTYTVVDGLASPDVTGVFQDRRGNIWLTTRDNGISQFDGESFQSFTIEELTVLDRVTGKMDFFINQYLNKRK